jgi:hypothetical protein
MLPSCLVRDFISFFFVRFTFQMRDAILKGAHPVNQDEAIQFAGYQAQIQFGDHNSSKHKPGFLE